MRVDIGSIHVDTGTQRFFPRFRPPRNPLLALLYAIVMLYVYAFLLEIYAIIALVLVAIWLGYLAWQWIQRQRAVAAEKHAQNAAYQAELVRRADQQNADYLAGGTGLPEVPLTAPADPPVTRVAS